MLFVRDLPLVSLLSDKEGLRKFDGNYIFREALGGRL